MDFESSRAIVSGSEFGLNFISSEDDELNIFYFSKYIFSSSSSDEIKFKPNSLPETIALELSKSKSRNHDSDHSETQKDSFAIIDDLSGR